MHANASFAPKLDILHSFLQFWPGNTRKTKMKKRVRERERERRTFSNQRGVAEVAHVASLPLVNLLFLLYRLGNNRHTEQIQFLRSKWGLLVLTVPESLGPRQRFLSAALYTATSTTAQFSGSSQTTTPASFNCTHKWTVQHVPSTSIDSKQLYPSNLNPALIIVCSCSFKFMSTPYRILTTFCPSGFWETLHPMKKNKNPRCLECMNASISLARRRTLPTPGFLVRCTCMRPDRVSIRCLKGGQQ